MLKKLDLMRDALDVFVDAVQKEPLHWGAWKELALLITDKETVCRLGGGMVVGKGV